MMFTQWSDYRIINLGMTYPNVEFYLKEAGELMRG